MVRKISVSFAALLLIWAAMFMGIVGGEDVKNYDYTISAIYEYENKIDAVDIIKNRDFTGSGNVLLITTKENGRTIRAKAVYLDENMPVGENEITVGGFEIGENETLFITVWESTDTVKPLTDGNVPEITKETERIEGAASDWTVSENGKRIVAYTGEDTEIVVPNYLNGKHITEVGAYTDANERASIFYDRAEEITSLTISEGIKKIGYTAFLGCKNVQNDLIIPDSVSYIGLGAFYNCINMTGDVVIPEKVEYIPNLVFAGCFKITSVDLGDNISSIGNYAFYYCKGLSGELKIPDSVSRIGDFAFTGCAALSGNPDLGGAIYIGNGAFAGCTGLSGGLNLPKDLTYIGYGAFEKCYGFTGELILPEKLEHIGDAAFNHCYRFTNETLIIPASVKALGGDIEVEENTGYSSHLFYNFGTGSFKAFEVESGNEYFCAESGVLYNKDKTRLIAYPRGKTDKTYEIPEGVVQIDELAFSRCTNIEEIILPDSYVIGTEVPANVINQDGNTLAVAIYNNTGIKKVSVKETNPNYISENGILYSKDKKSLWYCPTEYSGAVEVLSGTERIEKGAFYGASGLVGYTSVSIPDSVTYIAPETITMLNATVGGNITVAEGNTNYTVTDGKLKAVE